MLIRLCGFGGNGDKYEIICGEYQNIWPANYRNKKYQKIAASRDFGNYYQGAGTHWIESFDGKTLD